MSSLIFDNKKNTETSLKILVPVPVTVPVKIKILVPVPDPVPPGPGPGPGPLCRSLCMCACAFFMLIQLAHDLVICKVDQRKLLNTSIVFDSNVYFLNLFRLIHQQEVTRMTTNAEASAIAEFFKGKSVFITGATG